MFTGIIKELGQLQALRPNATGVELQIHAPKLIHQIQVDDSVAVNGVCLTATQIKGTCFQAQAVHVTLEKTNLGRLKLKDTLNLELALRLSDRLGGHLVQGHVNAVARYLGDRARGENRELSFELPRELARYVMAEGSIAINGVSLTVARLEPESFCCSLIPHTLDHTNLSRLRSGDLVNLEVDLLAKYLERLISAGASSEGPGIQNEQLQNWGFLS